MTTAAYFKISEADIIKQTSHSVRIIRNLQYDIIEIVRPELRH